MEKWQNYSKGCTSSGSHVFRPYSSSSKFYFLYSFDFYRSTKFSSWQWYTLHPKCHHQITYCEFNLNMKYQPVHKWLVWDYKRANVESIKRFIELVNWKTLFKNKTFHNQVSIFNETLMKIFQILLQTNT